VQRELFFNFVAMLPFYKVFSLFVRVFARPIIMKTKAIHLAQGSSKNMMLRKWFIYLGNKFQSFEVRPPPPSHKFRPESTEGSCESKPKMTSSSAPSATKWP
jgi:hypothetical protein